MKRITTVLAAIGVMISMTALMLTSCTKEGPQGPAGANGTNGTNGTNGSNGNDANATCTLCHNFNDSIVTKIFQYDASQHATGSTVFEATRNSCAPCHSSQGFDDVIASNADTSNQAYYDAAPINCRTCHKIHDSYTPTDWSLKITTAFAPRFDKTKTMNLAVDGGSSNLCARCHQARAASPALTNPTSNTDSIKITSNRWGPHHGPQSLILAGMGAYEINGTAFNSSTHKDVASCSTCHQADAQGDLVGGHTLWMTNDETGDNIGHAASATIPASGCKKCHPSITNFDYNGVQTEIEGLYQTLKVKLAEAQMLDTTTMLLKVPKKYSQKALGVYWNFCLIDADRSWGVHNAEYSREILQSGIDYFNARSL
jgi:hypothetical protein